jgi:hypothetical protein
MKMSKEEREARAKDIVLSCRRCRSFTDYHYNAKFKIWKIICECGKTAEYDDLFVQAEIEMIANEPNVE